MKLLVTAGVSYKDYGSWFVKLRDVLCGGYHSYVTGLTAYIHRFSFFFLMDSGGLAVQGSSKLYFVVDAGSP